MEKSKNHTVSKRYNKSPTLQQEIGSGGYGKVYRARHRENSSIRAIKVIPRPKIRNYERFKKEVDVLKTLVSDPNNS